MDGLTKHGEAMSESGIDKVAHYAKAMDWDISAMSWEQVRDGKLWRGYAGTIYGKPVGTEAGGLLFDHRDEALENARRMRDECRAIMAERQE